MGVYYFLIGSNMHKLTYEGVPPCEGRLLVQQRCLNDPHMSHTYALVLQEEPKLWAPTWGSCPLPTILLCSISNVVPPNDSNTKSLSCKLPPPHPMSILSSMSRLKLVNSLFSRTDEPGQIQELHHEKYVFLHYVHHVWPHRINDIEHL